MSAIYVRVAPWPAPVPALRSNGRHLLGLGRAGYQVDGAGRPSDRPRTIERRTLRMSSGGMQLMSSSYSFCRTCAYRRRAQRGH
eukprot:7655629-Pyramimonas_sp.AAC.3